MILHSYINLWMPLEEQMNHLGIRPFWIFNNALFHWKMYVFSSKGFCCFALLWNHLDFNSPFRGKISDGVRVYQIITMVLKSSTRGWNHFNYDRRVSGRMHRYSREERYVVYKQHDWIEEMTKTQCHKNRVWKLVISGDRWMSSSNRCPSLKTISSFDFEWHNSGQR